MKIKALVPFSNGTISMEQYEVREVEDSLGNELISAGVAVEIGGGGSGGGVLVVHQSGDNETGYTLDKTWQEIHDADFPILVDEGTDGKWYDPITSAIIEGQNYIVTVSTVEYGTNSADGYPKSAGGK